MAKNFLAILFFLIILGSGVYLIINREAKLQLLGETGRLYPARYSESLAGGAVRCLLCPFRCLLAEGQIGLCKARQNVGGTLQTLTYGKVSSRQVDPVEKKPFFHVLPGSRVYSIAVTGCNLKCLYCQNWSLSQVFPEEVDTIPMTPAEVVQAAVDSQSSAIAFTYNEPTVYFEYLLDIAKLAKDKGLKTLVVSNGYINPAPLRELLPFVDAYKIDFKGYDDKFYQEVTGGHLAPVLESMKIIRESNVWLEVVNLLVPGKNDSDDQIRSLVQWIKENLGTDVPLHFSRFQPQYRLENLPPTPVTTVVRARQLALEAGLKYVYTGNIIYPPGEATYCPTSGQVAVARQGYVVNVNNLQRGRCPDGEKIPGLWE